MAILRQSTAGISRNWEDLQFTCKRPQHMPVEVGVNHRFNVDSCGLAVCFGGI